MKASTSASISLVEMPGLDHRAQAVLDLGEDPPGRPHVAELARRLEEDHEATGSLTAFRIASATRSTGPSPATRTSRPRFA